MDVVGIVRFSVASADSNHFRPTRVGQSVDEHVASVLHPKRIAQRLELFRQIPLKSFQRQTDKRFRVVMLISSLLCERSKRDIASLSKENPFLVVEEVGLHDSIRTAAKRTLPKRCVTFRLDDDDAVFPGFVAELREAAHEVAPKTVISFPNGFYVGSKRNAVQFQSHRWVSNAYGIAYSTDDGSSIFDLGGHGKLERFPIVMRETPQAWMRSIHGGSASDATMSRKLPMTVMPPVFMKDFAPAYDFIDFEIVRDLLRAPEG